MSSRCEVRTESSLLEYNVRFNEPQLSTIFSAGSVLRTLTRSYFPYCVSCAMNPPTLLLIFKAKVFIEVRVFSTELPNTKIRVFV